MKLITTLLMALAVAVAAAGPYSDQVRTDPPQSGRIITEDGNAINMADHVRGAPINIARGLYPGAQPMASYGERITTGVEANFPVWPNGAIQFLPQLGVQISIVSTSANDSAAGTHVQVLEMHYLNRKLEQRNELVYLNGTTPVLTKATDVRWIQCMHIHRVGTAAEADGTITASYDGSDYSYIPIGSTRCASSFRMVPAGMHLYLDGAVGGSISATADTTTRLRIVASQLDSHIYDTNPPILIPFASTGIQNGSIAFNFPPGARFDPGVLVGCTHTTNKATTVSCSWFGRLEPIADVGDHGH